MLTVSRAHPDWKAPFTGMVPITTGEIAEDMAVYMQDSEQVSSAIAVGRGLHAFTSHLILSCFCLRNHRTRTNVSHKTCSR